jgi:hypothetical protein
MELPRDELAKISAEGVTIDFMRAMQNTNNDILQPYASGEG